MSERVANWPETGCTNKHHIGPRALGLAAENGAREPDASVVLPPSRVRTKAEGDGWTIDRKWKAATCPDHAPTTEVKPAPRSADAKQGHKAVWALLLANYDEDAKGYADGWSDERVATETGMSVQHVAAIRDEHFGPAEDPRIGVLREEILATRKDWSAAREALQRSIDEMREIHQHELDEVNRRFTERLDDLGKRVARLSG